MSRTAKALILEDKFKDELLKLITEVYLEHIDAHHTVVQNVNNEDIKILKFQESKYNGEVFGVGIIKGEVCEIYNGYTGYGIRALSIQARWDEAKTLVLLLKLLEDKFCTL